MIEYSETWQSFRDLTFKNPLESRVSFNEKCLVGRMVMNQSALYSPDLEECFTYSKRIRTTHRKFSTGFWSQSLRQKLAQGGRFGRASETWISKNPLESHFSFHKKCFVGRTVMNQNALYSPNLGECFTKSKRIRTTHRKFSTGFWSQSLHQKEAQNDRIFWSLAELQRQNVWVFGEDFVFRSL